RNLDKGPTGGQGSRFERFCLDKGESSSICRVGGASVGTSPRASDREGGAGRVAKAHPCERLQGCSGARNSGARGRLFAACRKSSPDGDRGPDTRPLGNG